MISSTSSPHAIIVLPPGRAGRIRDRRLRRWLSKGRLSCCSPAAEILLDVLELIGHRVDGEGLAALCFWGQSGEPSSAWMAAADPVHLEARLDHLRLHALCGAQMPLADLRSIVDYLQSTFGSEQTAFARVGHQIYLRSTGPMASADVSARFVDGLAPDAFMPEGRAANSLNLLLSEVQMALHEHPVNIDRQQAGRPEVNSLWVWGGGRAATVSAQAIMPLFADDPLFRGFWFSRGGRVEPWTDHLENCLQGGHERLVAVAPERVVDGQFEAPDNYLRQLQRLLREKKLGHLSLLFRDGLRAELSMADTRRFWRREHSLVLPE